jgi:2'-5' RNA ligase
MRLFLSIFPPEEILVFFRRIQNELKDFNKYIRFIEKDQIHLTIRFLGDNIDESVYLSLQEGISKIVSGFEPFNIHIQSLEFGFPGELWPKILYVSVKQNESLDKIISQVNHFCNPFSLDSTENETIYHFTLGRKMIDIKRDVVKTIKKSLKKFEMYEGFRVSQIFLVQSILGASGPRYSIKHTFDLH